MAISRSISWAQLSGVITADTHAACAEMFAKFWNISVAERVVDDLADPLLAHGRHADQVEDARPLGLGPHHAVERGQLADGVRGREQRAAPYAGVAVSRVGRVQFVGTADPADRLAPHDRIVELEGEVTRNAEAVGDPLACEPLDDVIGHSQLLTHWISPFVSE